MHTVAVFIVGLVEHVVHGYEANNVELHMGPHVFRIKRPATSAASRIQTSRIPSSLIIPPLMQGKDIIVVHPNLTRLPCLSSSGLGTKEIQIQEVLMSVSTRMSSPAHLTSQPLPMPIDAAMDLLNALVVNAELPPYRVVLQRHRVVEARTVYGLAALALPQVPIRQQKGETNMRRFVPFRS